MQPREIEQVGNYVNFVIPREFSQYLSAKENIRRLQKINYSGFS